MQLGLAPSYAALCLLQGAVVLAPGRVRSLRSSAAIGLVVPVAALAVGVALVRSWAGGAGFLSGLAGVGAPLLAAAVGPFRDWRNGWLTVPAAVMLFAGAWRAPADGLLAEACACLLVAGACLTLATAIRAVASEGWIAAGLVALVCLDVVLVWGTPEVGPTTQTLHAAKPPTAPVPFLTEHRLPRLQDVTFGSALMGWLDLLAPALLGTIPRRRLEAAAATTAAALLWGLLLLVTDPIPATVPVLAGLAAAFIGPLRGSRRLSTRSPRWGISGFPGATHAAKQARRRKHAASPLDLPACSPRRSRACRGGRQQVGLTTS